MSLTDLIYLSQKSLRSNILRSVLTSLGIIIGVSSVITMISIGSGARQEVEEQIERFGSNNLIVRSQSSSSRGVSMGSNSVNTLTLKDMEALKAELPAISATAGQHILVYRDITVLDAYMNASAEFDINSLRKISLSL